MTSTTRKARPQLSRLAGILALTLSTSLLASNFQISGPINRIDATSINIIDAYYPLSPTVKVYSPENKRLKLRQLSPGDIVRIQILDLGDKKLVDTIRLIKSN